MRDEVQHVFDVCLLFFEENIGNQVNYNSSISIITENGVHIYKDVAKLVGLDGDHPLNAMIRGAVDYVTIAISLLSNVVSIMEGSEIPGSRVSGIVVSVIGRNNRDEDVIVLDAYDRDGGEDHAICEVEYEDGKAKILETGPNDDEDRFFLRQGIWPWQQTE